jgi:CBS domain-containing protein
MLQLRAIMTREVRTLTPDTSLRAAMELFETYHISAAPQRARAG